MLGAIGLCLKHNLPSGEIVKVFYSAPGFRALGQDRQLYIGDSKFLDGIAEFGIEKSLTNLCGLNPVFDKELIGELI